MASYVFCRVCDERHDTYDTALEDLTGLVEDERYYTRNASPPKITRRTPMVGIGSHGGRGLFLLGACAGRDWEDLGDSALPYRHRIEVLWDGAIYGADYGAVFRCTTSARGRRRHARTTAWSSIGSLRASSGGACAPRRGCRGRARMSGSAERRLRPGGARASAQ